MCLSGGRRALTALFVAGVMLGLAGERARAQCRGGSGQGRQRNSMRNALRQQNALLTGFPQQQDPLLTALLQQQQNALLAALQQQQQNALLAGWRQPNALQAALPRQQANAVPAAVQQQQRQNRLDDNAAPAPKPPDPEEKEETAARRLKLAKGLAADGKVDRARDRYEDIIQLFPGTKAAEEAELLLRQMGP
jgi:hypothetical protein